MTYLLALLSGIALGTLGGGGSILIVPILTYLMEFSLKLSIPMSLAIVAISSSTAVISNLRDKVINYKIAVQFIIFSLLGTSLGSYSSQFVSESFQFILFSTVIILAAVSMLRKRPQRSSNDSIPFIYFAISALSIGVLTGLIGVGGGFLIVPTLNIIGRQNIKVSIATSLFVIAINSLGGFIQYLTIVNIPWIFLLKFSAFASIGSFIGSKIAKKANPEKLKASFAYFLVLMGVFMMVKTTF